MSSKFSMPWGVQKPPPVCKKGPFPPQFPPPPFNQQIYQGFCSWDAPAYGYDIKLSGPTLFVPNFPYTEHEGAIAGDQFQITASMVPAAGSPAFEFEIRIFENGNWLETKITHIPHAESLDPFDTGLVQFPVASPGDLVQLRVWT